MPNYDVDPNNLLTPISTPTTAPIDFSSSIDFLNNPNEVPATKSATPSTAVAPSTTQPTDNTATSLNNSFIDNPSVTQQYGAKTYSFYGPNGHEGTDYHAAVGTNLYGLKGWRVLFAGKGESYYGNKIILQNPQTGEKLEFAHLNDETVKPGDIIPSDKYIIGHTGNSGQMPNGEQEAAHLHVNYYTADGKRADVTKPIKTAETVQAAQQTASNFPIVPTVDTLVNKYQQQNPQQTQPKTTSSTPTTPTEPQQPTLEDLGKSLQQQAKIAAPTLDAAHDTTYNGNGYLVKPGDSLSAIARNLGVTMGTLMAKNNITNPNRIYSGHVLKY